MGAKETILTAEGLRKLEDELENLRSVNRQEVAERIKVAISYGDISENSEYDDAKNEQAFIEGRIIELEQMISTATLIDETAKKKKGTVILGSTVIVKDMEFGDEPILLSALLKPILRRTVSPMNHRSALRFWDRK